ncbi:polysaccharide deacetylase family protein [Clostridium sp. CTA-5]
MIYKNNLLKCTVLILTLVFISINSLCFTNLVYSDEYKGKILILYDSYKQYGKKENVLNDITKMALSTGMEVDIIKLNAYRGKDLSEYEGIFILRSTKNNLNNSIKNNLYNYNKQIFWFGENSEINFFKNNSIKYIDNLEFSEENYRTLYNLIYNSFKEEDYSKNKMYFCLDEVTPFNDLNVLIEEINYLKEWGIPFFIQVTPVFKNKKLPAMNRFVEVLRYAQVNGGEIILTIPYLDKQNIEGNIITKKIEEGFLTYIDYLVYPIAFSVHDYWLYREDLKPLLESSNTLLLSSSSDLKVLDFDSYSISDYKNIIQKVSFDNDKNVFLNESSNNVAISVSSRLSFDDFKKSVSMLKNKNIDFKSTYSINSNIKIENISITSNQQGMFLNNKNVTQSRFISNKEYIYDIFGEQNENTNKTNINLSLTNKILEIITFIVAITFMIIVLISIKIDKRKFFK